MDSINRSDFCELTVNLLPESIQKGSVVHTFVHCDTCMIPGKTFYGQEVSKSPSHNSAWYDEKWNIVDSASVRWRCEAGTRVQVQYRTFLHVPMS